MQESFVCLHFLSSNCAREKAQVPSTLWTKGAAQGPVWAEDTDTSSPCLL